MNHGICIGGPFDGRPLADPTEVFPVWEHPASLKIITGLPAGGALISS